MAQRSLRECSTPTLLLLTLRHQVEEIVATTHSGPVSAIYLEADPILNLQLIKRALPNVATVAVLVSPGNEAWLPKLHAEANRLGFVLEALQASNDEEAVHRVRERLGHFDALLLLPDERLINGWSLKPILLMTARSLVPVFGGPVEGYVKVGVTAAVVPDLEQAGPQIKRFVRKLAQGKAPEPGYPEATRIVVNERVVRTLSIKTDLLEGADAQ